MRGGSQIARCLRCEAEPEDLIHCVYLCPCNSQIDNDGVEKTNYLKEKSGDELLDCAALYLRGLVPQELLKISVPAPRTVNLKGENVPQGEWSSQEYVTDASWGPRGDIRALRRVACAIVGFAFKFEDFREEAFTHMQDPQGLPALLALCKARPLSKRFGGLRPLTGAAYVRPWSGRDGSGSRGSSGCKEGN